jgi:rSAM-associated Gly-rich repeat protein
VFRLFRSVAPAIDKSDWNARLSVSKEAQMTVRRKTRKALAMLLPAGVLGISSALASARVEPLPQDRISPAKKTSLVSERLLEIRTGVSELNALTQKHPGVESGVLVADWVNGGFGWGNGGWHNGGWHNGPGWGNGGWHNWGNGGWHNWHNGWHNWHNYWHNW